MISSHLRALLCVVFAALLFGCSLVRPQQGGVSTTTLGGANAATVITNKAPENPQTPSETKVEKTTTREYVPQNLAARPAAPSVGVHDSAGLSSGADGAHTALVLPPFSPLLRETVVERATTSTGAAQKDTTRELGVRLANMRGVLWVGVLLLIGGPVVGWKLGWFTNGCIAGGVGLLLIILSSILPGNEAWFGLGGLLLIPLVAFVYYRAHHDANNPTPTS